MHKSYFTNAVIISTLLLSSHMSYAQDPVKQVDNTEQKVTTNPSADTKSPESSVAKKASASVGGVKTSTLTPRNIPDKIDYSIVGYIEDVYFPGGGSVKTGSTCYIAFNGESTGWGSNYGLNKYEASQNFETCQFSERAYILKEKIKADLHHNTGNEANDVVGIHFADTKASWWGE